MKIMNGPHKYIWTQFEINFIKVHFLRMTNRQIADILGHKVTLLRMKCYEMGLKRMELEYWTEEQITFLKNNYKKYGDTELAQMFSEVWPKAKGWNKKHIEKKRRYLNLKRDKQQRDLIREGHKKAGVYKVGLMKTWAVRGVAKIGSTRTWIINDRPVKVLKLKHGFVHYAHWLWEQTHGPVPEGCVIRLKDENPENVVIGNLELITRGEHATRNSKNRMPAEIREIAHLNRQLEQKILKIQKNEKQNK